eukprot:746332-Hanusia_phi.AAC.18
MKGVGGEGEESRTGQDMREVMRSHERRLVQRKDMLSDQARDTNFARAGQGNAELEYKQKCHQMGDIMF